MKAMFNTEVLARRFYSEGMESATERLGYDVNCEGRAEMIEILAKVDIVLRGIVLGIDFMCENASYIGLRNDVLKSKDHYTAFDRCVAFVLYHLLYKDATAVA